MVIFRGGQGPKVEKHMLMYSPKQCFGVEGREILVVLWLGGGAGESPKKFNRGMMKPLQRDLILNFGCYDGPSLMFHMSTPDKFVDLSQHCGDTVCHESQ